MSQPPYPGSGQGPYPPQGQPQPRDNAPAGPPPSPYPPQGHPQPGWGAAPQQGPQQYGSPYATPHQQPYGQQQYAPAPSQQQQGPYGPPPQLPQQQQPYPGPRPQGDPQTPPCTLCGSGPAAKATFLAVTGIVIMHTITRMSGPFCRDCGLHFFRAYTTKTLMGGCFSVGAIIISPFFLINNLVRRGKLAKLPEPRPYLPGARLNRPLDPGPPVYTRPAAYVWPLLILVVIMANVVSAAARG